MQLSTQIPGIDKIFVLHCKKGYEVRDESIRTQFAKHGLPFEYVLDWDVGDLNGEVKQNFSPSLSDVLISISLKHIEVMKLVIQNGHERCLVFEDDIFLFPSFRKVLQKVVNESNRIRESHVIYLSNSCNKYTPRSQRVAGQVLYEQNHSRAADAYLLTREVCRKRLHWLETNSVSTALDHIYAQMDHEIGIKMYWVEDPICEQGSMNGLFQSSVENEHSIWVQRVRWKLDKFYKMHVLRNLR